MRESLDFKASGLIAEQKKVSQSDVKSQTPLVKLIDLPWCCPIDPMHQVFLGTGKVLSKVLISLAKGNLFQRAERLLSLIKIPFDIQHRTRSLHENKVWKAFDFKLFFFHVGQLIFFKIPARRGIYESFCTLSMAIRLLSDEKVDEQKIEQAESLINLFFENFVELYGIESQSFTFHTMRHLAEQVRRSGPLWMFSAFCFESANHGLLSAVQGTIKGPEAIVENFIKHQASFDDIIHEKHEQCLKGLTIVTDDIKKFCQDKNVEFFFSRYVTPYGQCFASLCYSRIGNNFGECILCLSDSRFFRVETYFSNDDGIFAVGKAAKYCRESNILGKQNSFGFIFELFGLNVLEIIPVKNICNKTVVLN